MNRNLVRACGWKWDALLIAMMGMQRVCVPQGYIMSSALLQITIPRLLPQRESGDDDNIWTTIHEGDAVVESKLSRDWGCGRRDTVD